MVPEPKEKNFLQRKYRIEVLTMSVSSTIFYASSTVLVFNAWMWLSDRLGAPPGGPEIKRRKKKEIPRKTVEICCDSVGSAIAAVQGGCNSVELCLNRAEGGMTPSIGMIKEIVHRLKTTNVLVNVLIRPREGDFIYDDTEFEVMLRDIIYCMEVGVDGIVVGLLTKNGDIDTERLQIIKSIVGDCILVTFHRAFDQCKDALQALEGIIRAKCDRLLTSGQCNTALQGSNELANLINVAAGRINIVAAAGINVDNVAAIVSKTGVTAIHVGSAVVVSSTNADVELNMKKVNVGLVTQSNIYSFSRVCSKLVAEIVDACGKAWSSNKAVDMVHSTSKKELSVDVNSTNGDTVYPEDGDDACDFVHITKSVNNSPRIRIV